MKNMHKNEGLIGDVITLPTSDQRLLDECEVQSYRSSGSGGQHVNTTDSAVRLKHLPTGITVTCSQERSQYLNKLICLQKLRAKVARMNEKPLPRIATKKPRRAKEKVLKEKKQLSLKKKLRTKFHSSD